MIENWRSLPRGWRFLALALLVLGLAFAGCSDQGRTQGSDDAETADGASADSDDTGEDAGIEDEDDLVPVETVILERGEIEAVLRFSTNLEAESEVQVFSQASRLVTQLRVEEGDPVKKGQLLLQLQSDEQKSALAQTESQLRKAQREYERQQNLFTRELISEQAMTEATYEVEQLELALDDARRNLTYTEVRAPISGIVTGRHVNLGDHITVNQHLFDIVDFDTIVARVYVPERELPRLRVGQTARLFSGAADAADARTAGSRVAQARTGHVVRIAPIVDPKSGTVKVTAAIPPDQGLLPGMYVEVELVTDVHDDALLVPKRAVVYDNNQAFLFRLSEDLKTERLPLAVWLEDREHIEPVPGSTLRDGDEIVVAGQAGLKDGVRVRRAREKGAQNQAAGDPEGTPST